MDDHLLDSRFTNIIKDKKFKRVPKHERKVIIDKRFQSMFNENKFKVPYKVNKKGRPDTSVSNDNLKKYYHLSSDDDNESESEEEDKKSDSKEIKIVGNDPLERSRKNKDKNSVDPDDDAKDIKIVGNDRLERKNLSEKIKNKLHDLSIDYARGGGIIATDSSSEDSSSEDEFEEEEEEEEIDHKWGELDKDAESTTETTSRLALCNMNWDRVKAKDLMVLFHSFIPSSGVIKSITIYPSEFGLERMKQEDLHGPKELRSENTIQDDKEETGEDDEDKINMEKLREYQLNRLKYYYAVIECDSKSTANNIYTQCDGLEYESSASKIDLRFIPEDMTFDQEPREKCDGLPDLMKYEPHLFTTSALQQGKVNLTWDETDPQRTKLTQKLFTNKNEDEDFDQDVRAYLASSSGDEDESSEENKNNNNNKEDNDTNDLDLDPISKYKSLLKDLERQEEEKKNKDIEMEITWGLGLKEKTEKLVKEKLKESMTPFEKMIEKKKEKKKQKMKEKKETKNADDDEVDNDDDDDDNEDNDDLFNDDDIPSDVDLNDSYFKEERENLKSNKKNKKKLIKDKINSEEDKQKAAELELLLMDEEEYKNHFNYKKIQEQHEKSNKKKNKKKKGKDNVIEPDNFEVNVKDERFSAIYTSHIYNIDPTDPHYKKTKGMEAFTKEKLSRRAKNEDEENSQPSKIRKLETKNEAKTTSIIKSIKSKSLNLKKKI